MSHTPTPKPVYAVDLFCGVGGLSFGLQQAGVDVRAGVDLDKACEYAYEANIGAGFVCDDVRNLSGRAVKKLFPAKGIRLLAGCAPCQPFSSHRRGADTSGDEKWSLLDEFARLVREVRPELVTMENVSGLERSEVFVRFRAELIALGYYVDWANLHAECFGLPQHRRRLVLMASRLGPITVPDERGGAKRLVTVREAIGDLPQVAAGESHPKDVMHRARILTPTNMERMRHSKPGGTWRDWPAELRSPCHQRATGATFQSVYARMKWDEPSPTITTQAYNFGTGRFGHPEQDRALTLREAAVLQGFPKSYRFAKKKEDVNFLTLGRLIGNAVPPPLGCAIGTKFVEHLKSVAA